MRLTKILKRIKIPKSPKLKHKPASKPRNNNLKRKTLILLTDNFYMIIIVLVNSIAPRYNGKEFQNYFLQTLHRLSSILRYSQVMWLQDIKEIAISCHLSPHLHNPLKPFDKYSKIKPTTNKAFIISILEIMESLKKL